MPKMTQTQAINAFCKECIYDPEVEGSWRHQVETCLHLDCQLYGHRPVTGKLKAQIKAERLASMTTEERQRYDAKAQAARENLGRSLGRK